MSQAVTYGLWTIHRETANNETVYRGLITRRVIARELIDWEYQVTVHRD